MVLVTTSMTSYRCAFFAEHPELAKNDVLLHNWRIICWALYPYDIIGGRFPDIALQCGL
ncbi:hypothetical protein ABKV19_025296 [Rosa sericea]